MEFYANYNQVAGLCSFMPLRVVTGTSEWELVARVTANTGVFDRPQVLEPRASTSLVCHSFKFLQVKNHVSLSAIVSTLGQFRITSSDATHSYPFWNSETLTRFDVSVFQKQV